MRKLRPYLRHIQIASGIFLIAIGLLLVTNRMTTIAIWAQQNGFYLDLPLGGAAPTYLIAIMAGLLSFLSPCVLPLVPAYICYPIKKQPGNLIPGCILRSLTDNRISR